MGKRIELTEVYRPKLLLKGRSIGKTTMSNIMRPEEARKSKDAIVGAENVAGAGPAGHVISGETESRPAAGPATDPVTVGSTKRGDEVGSPDVQATHAPQLPQPPRSKRQTVKGLVRVGIIQEALLKKLEAMGLELVVRNVAKHRARQAEYRKRKTS